LNGICANERPFIASDLKGSGSIHSWPAFKVQGQVITQDVDKLAQRVRQVDPPAGDKVTIDKWLNNSHYFGKFLETAGSAVTTASLLPKGPDPQTLKLAHSFQQTALSDYRTAVSTARAYGFRTCASLLIYPSATG
jgi:hypothetical protein